MPYLFVYGTLRSTFDNRWARRLRREADFVGRGRVRGRVTRVGRYTALVPTGIRNIDGEVYRLRAARTLAVLDRYEGSGYERVTVRVRTCAGRSVFAWVYVRARGSNGHAEEPLAADPATVRYQEEEFEKPVESRPVR